MVWAHLWQGWASFRLGTFHSYPHQPQLCHPGRRSPPEADEPRKQRGPEALARPHGIGLKEAWAQPGAEQVKQAHIDSTQVSKGSSYPSVPGTVAGTGNHGVRGSVPLARGSPGC